jgi:sugar O-acyltransferase (sialic acid O-acetyltransferase NeuD family)
MTGWAQVNGRNASDWETRFEQDVWYVERHNLWLDAKIIAATIFAVLRRHGIQHQGHATMPPFLGEPRAAPPPTAAGSSDLIVIGAGGHAAAVIAAIQASGLAVGEVYDDDPQRWGQEILGVTIVGPVARLNLVPRRRAVIAIGDSGIRRKLALQLNLEWVRVIHPFSWVHPGVEIGPGAVIMPGAIVQPRTRVGPHAIINTSASVDHDSDLSGFTHIAPGARLAGGVIVEEHAFVGMGATILPGTRIGNAAVVGAGAVVLDDVPPGATVVGVP